MDDTEEELEMADDPFLVAGLDIPTNLPEYVNLKRSNQHVPKWLRQARQGIQGQNPNLPGNPTGRQRFLPKFRVIKLFFCCRIKVRRPLFC